MQVPDNLDEPAQKLMRELATRGPVAGQARRRRSGARADRERRSGITGCCVRVAVASMCGGPRITTRSPTRAPSSSGSKAPGCAPSWILWTPPERRISRALHRAPRAGLSVARRRGAAALSETLHGGPALTGRRRSRAAAARAVSQQRLPQASSPCGSARIPPSCRCRQCADRSIRRAPIALARNRMVRMPSPAPFG